MRLLRAATFFVCCASLAFAQNQAENLCGSASVTTVDHDGGVTVQKVTLSRKWGRNEAIAYLPDKKIADGAIAFSHSAIHADNGGFGRFAGVCVDAGSRRCGGDRAETHINMDAAKSFNKPRRRTRLCRALAR